MKQADPIQCPPAAAGGTLFSCAQEQIWLHERLYPGLGLYNVAELFDIRGPVEEGALRSALCDVVVQQDSLRTRYIADDGMLWNVVAELDDSFFERGSSSSFADAYEWCVAFARRPFQMASGRPFRAGFIRYAAEAAVLVLAYHHLAYDHGSGGVVLADLSNAYAARITGIPLTRQPDANLACYADFADWQRAAVARDKFVAQRDFWKRTLHIPPPAVELPADTDTWEGNPLAGAAVDVFIAAATTAGLRALAGEEGASLFTVILAAFRTLVSRYTGLDDIVIGVPAASRALPQMAAIVGCFVNTLPLRTAVSRTQTFRGALRITRDAARDAYAAREYPFSAIVRDCLADSSRRESGFLRVTATMRDPRRPQLRLHGAMVEPRPIDLGVAMFDCSLVVTESQGGLRCTIEYRRARFSPTAMASFAQAFNALLTGAAAGPDSSCATLPLTKPSGLRALLRTATGPVVSLKEPATIGRLLARQVEQHPDAVAVVDGPTTTSYRELLERADRISRALAARNVKRGDRIGVCAERSTALIAAMLGIVGMGAIYVPLDPALPDARLAAITTAAALDLVIAGRKQAPRFAHATVVELAMLEKSDRWSLQAPHDDAQSSEAAYIVFTSGSSGIPKGIAVPHRAIVNVVHATREALGIVPSDRYLFRAALGFDPSLIEMLVPLSAGAAIVVAPDRETADARALLTTIIEQRVTVLGVVPSLLDSLLEQPRWGDGILRIVTSGGEALSGALEQRFFDRSAAKLFNLYGPSEAAAHVTIHECSRVDRVGDDRSVSLGRPIANAVVSVRDDALTPLPPGAVGEIIISGLPVALGYVGLPMETERRFVADPFVATPPTCYRTGDRARLLTNGTLSFLGRNDGQVKVRGVRIEPTDVAAALQRLSGVRQAHVIARARDGSSGARDVVLIAYVVGDQNVDRDEVRTRQALSRLLPRYMLPAIIRFIDEMPLTPNGKVDIAALTLHESAATRSADAVSIARTPATPIERCVAGVLEEVLGSGPIALDDDFFDMGGHSLLAVRALARIERDVGCAIPLSSFFDEPTIAGITRLLGVEGEPPDLEAKLCNTSGSNVPFVLLHGDFGGGRYARRLAALLGPDQPMTIFAPHGLERDVMPPDIDLMAMDFARRIAGIYPRGRLRIGGFSMAGIIALEVARLLHADGYVVEDVVAIGTDALNVRLAGVDRMLKMLPLPAEKRQRYLRRTRRLAILVSGLVHGDSSARAHLRIWLHERFGLCKLPRGSVSADSEQTPTYQEYVIAHHSFIPCRYTGSVLLIWPRDQHPEAGNPIHHWRRITTDLTVASIGGDHFAPVTTELENLAAILRERFIGLT